MSFDRELLLEVHLIHMLRWARQNTCHHEETHRGGVLWEICDLCGAKWADDEGGKPEWEDPKVWQEAEELLRTCNAQDRLIEAFVVLYCANPALVGAVCNHILDTRGGLLAEVKRHYQERKDELANVRLAHQDR